MALFPPELQLFRPTGTFQLNEDSPQAQGLIGWWPLIDDYRDYSVYNRGFLTPGGSVSFVSDSELIKCGDFPDDGEYTLNDAPVTSEPFTFASWHWRPTGASDTRIVDFGNTSDTYYWRLGIAQPSGIMRAWVADSGGQVYATALTTAEEIWYHQVVVFESSVLRRCYGNGIEGAGSPNTDSASPTTPTLLRIGSDARYGDSDWNGRITDVRFYDRAVDPSTIYAMWDPSTRWDLQWTPGRVSYFFFQSESAFIGAPDPCVVPIQYEL